MEPNAVHKAEPPPTPSSSSLEPAVVSTKHLSDTAPGTKAVINGKPSVWIPGFCWIEDNGGGNAGTVAEDMYENGHKIGIMD